MDPTKPTLPHLLNIVIPDTLSEPSYNRPATATYSTQNRFAFGEADFPKSSKGNQFSKTQNSFKPKVPLDQKVEKESPQFCYSGFKTPVKVLPKLYSAPQHETMSQKFKELKDRYQVLYKKIEGAENDEPNGVTNENLKDIYLEAEKMFNVTYSVKYFGVQGGELGIASKRVPMNQANNQNANDKRPATAQENFTYKAPAGRKDISAQGLRTRNLALNNQDSPKDDYNFTGNERKVLQESTRTLENEMKTSEIVNAHSSRPATSKNQGSSERRGFYQNEQMSCSVNQFKSYKPSSKNVSSDNLEKGIRMNEGEIDLDTLDEELLTTRAVNDPMTAAYMTTPRTATQGGIRSRLQSGRPRTGGHNDYVVTKYLIPKRLPTAKKKTRDVNTTASAVQTQRTAGTKAEGSEKTLKKNPSTQRGLHEKDEKLELWPKPLVGNQLENQLALKKAASLEKKITSMEKVKRNLLRNVHVEKAWESRTYKDELDIPEKFRTHEVKRVMADNAKYSYAKLLETMYTSDRPETALVESTEKMEKILSVREEKRKFLNSRGIKRNDDQGDIDKRDANGNYVVKVCYPKENEMFNRYWKIKHTVAVDQLEY